MMSGKLMVDAQVWDAQNKALRDYEDDIAQLNKENKQLNAAMAQAVVEGNRVLVDTIAELCDRVALAESERDRLRESLESLCCEAHDLSDHEIDGGAPDNRWEDMRQALAYAEQALNHKEA